MGSWIDALGIWFMMLVLTVMGKDCVWDFQTKKIVSQYPLGPYRSCLTYCETYYPRTPQRKYYNTTSQMCEPRRLCKSFRDHYDYETNRCYSDASLQTEAQSYIPQSLYSYQSLTDSSTEMNCINGVMEMNGPINGVVFCLCEMFWKDSQTVDMNGMPFKCDAVEDNPRGMFYNKLEYDEEGNIIKYGPFTPEQITIVIETHKQQQKRQTQQYISKHYQSVLYAIEKSIPSQTIFQVEEGPLLIVFMAIAIVLVWVSYYEQRRLTIPISRVAFKNKIYDILSNNHPEALVRSVS